MTNNNMNNGSYEEEISLKEIIMILYRKRVLIFVITVICVILSQIYSFYIAHPEYKSTSEVLINAPVSADTRYGTYTFSSTRVQDYAKYFTSDQVIIRVMNKLGLDNGMDSIRAKITINNEKESNRYVVVTSGDSPESAKILNDFVLDVFNKMIRITSKKHALDYFIGLYEERIISLNNSIAQTESIVSETKALMDSLEPIYTLQKALFSNPESAAIYANKFGLDLSTLSENVMVEEFANENYFKLEEQYTKLKIDLISLNQNLSVANNNLLDLQKEKEFYISNYQTENESIILNNKLDVYAQQFNVIAYALEPESPVGPRKALNFAIGVLLGLMLGCFAAFIKAYWEKA